MEEIWKDIEGYEGLYQVSNLGRVKSFPRKYTQKGERFLKIAIDSRGYSVVDLWKNNTRKNCRVHRLVAEAFVDNPYNKAYVNHIDYDRQNSKASNLEWVTTQENNAWSYNNLVKSLEKVHKSNEKSVCKYDMADTLLAVYTSIRKAGAENNIDTSSITKCCRGKYKTVGGFKWKYKGEEDNGKSRN